jgi:hypothetical protein
MRRLSTELPFTCVTCEIEIAGTPVFHVGLPFCCAGCVANGPCICSYDEPADVPVRVDAPVQVDDRTASTQRVELDRELALSRR